MKRFATTSLIAAALLFSSSVVFASGNIEAGKKKAQVCQACHGEHGNAPNPQYPKLAGQWESYLFATLKQYKSGARENPIMKGFASSLSEQDMHDLAAYYASLPGELDDLHGHIQGDD